MLNQALLLSVGVKLLKIFGLKYIYLTHMEYYNTFFRISYSIFGEFKYN